MVEHIREMAEELANGRAQLFDVRERDEWAEDHLADAVLVPLSALQQGEEPEGRDKGLKTYLHCRSGNRVWSAKPILEGMGFTHVIALNEGFKDLSKMGLKTGRA